MKLKPILKVQDFFAASNRVEEMKAKKLAEQKRAEQIKMDLEMPRKKEVGATSEPQPELESQPQP